MTELRSILALAILFVASCIEVTVDPPPPPPTPAAPARPAPPTKAVADAKAPAREPAARPPSAPTEPTSFAVREPVDAVAASLELVDAGQEPRRAVTLAATVGDRGAARIGLSLQVAMRVGPNEVPKTKLPRIDVDVETEVTRTSADRIELDLRVRDVTVDRSTAVSERVKAAIDTTVEGLRATKGPIVLGRDGRVESIALQGQADAIESRAAGLDHALVELLPAWPKAPIGVGAKWTVVQPVVRGGVTLLRTSEYTLQERTDARIVVAVEASHVAVKGGDATQGTTRIEAQSGAGTGRLVVRPGAALPIEGEIASSTATRASFGGAAQGVLVAIDLALALAPADTHP